MASFTNPDATDSFLDILHATGFPHLEITAENRSRAYKCLLQYEVITKRIPGLEDIRKGLASVQVKGVTLLDLLRIYPTLTRYVFPECKDNIDSRMLKLVMKYDEVNSDDEKQAQIFLEKYIEDLVEREHSRDESLKDLLQFWTGYPQLPQDSLSQLWVKFSVQQPVKVLAEADTCTLTLQIPTIHQQYEDFRKYMDFSIAYGKVGFGRM